MGSIVLVTLFVGFGLFIFIAISKDDLGVEKINSDDSKIGKNKNVAESSYQGENNPILESEINNTLNQKSNLQDKQDNYQD